MTEWATLTPDGRTLRVRRVRGAWVAWCDEGEKAEDELLDIALINAIRRDAAVVAHAPQPEYGSWIRAQADQIERDFTRARKRPDASRRPQV
jgi:hypothetical protein